MINAKQKRVTIPVSIDIDVIKERIRKDTGIIMSYTQLFNFLVHFYMEHSNEPRTKWQALK